MNPPKPTELKKLEGNPGNRPLNDAEPQPIGEAVCPEDLSDAEHAEWDRIAPILRRMKVLTEADVIELANLCRDIVQEREIAAAVKKVGLLRALPNGRIQINPLFGLQDTLRGRISTGLRNFGMNPSARTRIHIEKDHEQARGGVLNGQWLGLRKKPGRKPGAGAVPLADDETGTVQ